MKKIVVIAFALAAGFALIALHAHAAAPPQQQRAVATFAGGCFWCMVHPFDSIPGVVKVTSGYTGGRTPHPTYDEVSSGWTGHREAVQIVFDPRRVSYAQLLDVFWRNVDPANREGQFCDLGEQYKSAIYYHDATQKQLAESSKRAVAMRLKEVYTDVVPASAFSPAEGYHQNFYRKHPVQYKFYRFNCGRDHRLEQLWGKAAP